MHRSGAVSGGSNLYLFDESHRIMADPIQEAERILLELADFVYTHTPLKPMSKVLFFISRCLLLASKSDLSSDPSILAARYKDLRCLLGDLAPDDDYDFRTVASDCRETLGRIVNPIREVRELTAGSDGLGLAFDTLLRGKWEGGEGLGTFLTPEEVVQAMVDLIVTVVGDQAIRDVGKGGKPLLLGDICGGTGRFVYSLARGLIKKGVSKDQIERAATLLDQSSLAIGFGRINFLLHGLSGHFKLVNDSLIAQVASSLRERFLALATNPPFGTAKYEWSPALARELPIAILRIIGLRGPGDSADPSELFVYRNLDLLAPTGCLAIVLPDGVVASERFSRGLREYERVRECALELVAAVSLPVPTFSLGGTVAKTSFVLIQKKRQRSDHSLYVAVVEHIGFLKRGNRRVPDPAGNDLLTVVDEFSSKSPRFGAKVASWRHYQRLSPRDLLHRATNGNEANGTVSLGKVATCVREIEPNNHEMKDGARFHISVTDVDETGLIDVVSASKNRPSTPGLRCRPGDVLISCINPRIWRATVVPDIPGRWSCSPEFAVFRPFSYSEGWRLVLALHHPEVRTRVASLATGTSSSRQRVPKSTLEKLSLPRLDVGKETLTKHAESRVGLYLTRLREERAYSRLHKGEAFDFGS